MDRDRSADVRQSILDAAERLFFRDGIHATGVDAILKEAGASRQSLYTHFGSKNGLVAAVLDRRDRQWRGWFVSAVEERAAHPIARLAAIFDVLGEWIADPDFHGCPFANAVGETGAADDPARLLAKRHKQLVHDEVLGWTRAAGVADPDRLAHELALLMDGALATAMVLPGHPAACLAMAAAEAVIAAAFLPRPGGEAGAAGDVAVPTAPRP
jgi:AcrR family transcriptional regulator